MESIEITVNVITGVIEVDMSDFTDDDPRWPLVTGSSGKLCNRVEVEPWGEEEFGMERATEAVGDLLGIKLTKVNFEGWRQDGIHSDLQYGTVTFA